MPKAKRPRPIVSVHTSSSKPQQPQHGSGQPQLATQLIKKRPRNSDSTPNASTGQQKQTAPGSASRQPTKHAHNAKSGHQNVRKHHPHSLVCCSMVDRQAASAMASLLHADAGHGKGVTLKSLTLAPHIEAKKATYAVTCQAMKHLQILQDVVQHSRLMQQPGMDKLSECTAYVLVYELLMGQGLHQRGPAERLVAKHKAELQAALQRAMKQAGVKSVPQLLESRAGPPPPTHPKWVRVNTLKMDVKQALAQLKELHPSVSVDPLLPDLLRLPEGTSLHAHPLVASGALVQQSKASAMPAHALAPRPGWHCVDCCAAPGNKTTHLAALMQGSGRVDAYDKDPHRLKRLQANAELTGAAHVIHAHLQDFLTIDTSSAEFAQVRGVLLDPSCSGSGTLVTRQDHLLPSWGRRQAAMRRVRQQHAQIIAQGGPLVSETAQQQQRGSAAGAPDGSADVRRRQDDQGMNGSQCSDGSDDGMSEAEGDEEEEEAGEAEEDEEEDANVEEEAVEDDDMHRVEQLAKFQVAALRHALTFPTLERLVYSTCSIHAEENELVVQAVLPDARKLGFNLQAVFPSWTRRGLPYFKGCEKLIRTDPYEDDTDGFFVAVFQRQEQQTAEVLPSSASSRAKSNGRPLAHKKRKTG